MLIQDFRSNHKADLQKLPMSDIVLTEKVHIRGLKRGNKPVTIPEIPIVIVRREEGKYALIAGYRDYVTALDNHEQEIFGIIVPDKSRSDFFKSLASSSEIIKVKDLKVPKGWTKPRPEKVKACVDYYNNVGVFGKNVIVDENYEILDGYAAVVAAQRLGVETISTIVVERARWKKYPKKKIQNPLTKVQDSDIM